MQRLFDKVPTVVNGAEFPSNIIFDSRNFGKDSVQIVRVVGEVEFECSGPRYAGQLLLQRINLRSKKPWAQRKNFSCSLTEWEKTSGEAGTEKYTPKINAVPTTTPFWEQPGNESFVLCYSFFGAPGSTIKFSKMHVTVHVVNDDSFQSRKMVFEPRSGETWGVTTSDNQKQPQNFGPRQKIPFGPTDVDGAAISSVKVSGKWQQWRELRSLDTMSPITVTDDNITINMGARPTAHGRVFKRGDGTTPDTGSVNFPDDRTYKFWYYPKEGVVHWDSERGSNAWRKTAETPPEEPAVLTLKRIRCTTGTSAGQLDIKLNGAMNQIVSVGGTSEVLTFNRDDHDPENPFWKNADADDKLKLYCTAYTNVEFIKPKVEVYIKPVFGTDQTRVLKPLQHYKVLGFVVGITDYLGPKNAYHVEGFPRLPNAANDKGTISKVLERAHVEVHSPKGTHIFALEQCWEAFKKALNPGDLAFLFFAGHGCMFKNKQCLLAKGFTNDEKQNKGCTTMKDWTEYCKLKARAKEEEAAKFTYDTPAHNKKRKKLLAEAEFWHNRPTKQGLLETSLHVNDMLIELREKGVNKHMVLLDCCREFIDKEKPRAIGDDSLTEKDIAGLNVNIAEGTIIGYATGPDETAKDGGVGGNGPYTAALKNHLASENVPVDAMLARVGAEVAKATGGKQQPHRDSCMNREDVCLFVSKSRRM